jgi:hypothetical protein
MGFNTNGLKSLPDGQRITRCCNIMHAQNAGATLRRE